MKNKNEQSLGDVTYTRTHKYSLKNNKAITLVALIVTVIVLLILAGVAINFTVGNQGIISKVQTAVGKYENAQEKENNTLAGYEIEIDSARETVMVDKTEYENLKKIVEGLINYRLGKRTIGTWVNGKPLYEKMVTGIIADVNVETQSETIDENIDEAFIVDLFLVNGGAKALSPGSDSHPMAYWIRQNVNKLIIVNRGNDLTGMRYYAIIQYTKTTDEATIDIT